MKLPTAAQILTRKHNFRKGTLERIKANAKTLDQDLESIVLAAVERQAYREQQRHEARMEAIKTGDPYGLQAKDYVLADALRWGRVLPKDSLG